MAQSIVDNNFTKGYTLTHTSGKVSLLQKQVFTTVQYQLQLKIANFEYSGKKSHIRADMVNVIPFKKKFFPVQIIPKGESRYNLVLLILLVLLLILLLPVTWR
jgi:hypothetical protein